MICLAVNYLVKKKSIHFIFQILVFFFIFIQISSFKGNRYCLKKKSHKHLALLTFHFVKNTPQYEGRILFPYIKSFCVIDVNKTAKRDP